jgi:hypothetical protein
MSEHGATAIAQSGPRHENAPAPSASKYLYAIIAGQPELRYPAAGLGDADIYAIAVGGISAVVSDVAAGRLRAERRHLAAHRDVLARLMSSTTPLPVSFGTVAASAEAVRQILIQNQRSFVEQLNRVAGKAEMGLRVFWDVPNIFEYFINTHPELRVARDHLFGRRREPTQDEKLELGRFFENLLEEDREACAEKVEEGLSAAGVEHKRNKNRNEREILNLACLVPRGEQAAFEAQVLEVAKLFNNNYAFDYSGPWPPYNFVQMDLRLGSHAAD